MSGFKDTELEAAVDAVALGDVTPKRDALGTVDVDTAFSQTMELAGAALARDSDGVFYLVSLAANLSSQKVTAARTALEDLIELVQDSGRFTHPVDNLSSLHDAVFAIERMDDVRTNKGAIPSAQSTAFDEAVDNFTQRSLAPNIRSGGQLRRSPPEARAGLPAGLAGVKSAHAPILADVTRILGMLTVFKSLDLGLLGAKTTLRKARISLVGLKKSYEEAETPDAQVALSRDAFLKLQAAKAAGASLLTARDPELPRLQGTSANTYRASVSAAAKKATAAQVTGTTSAPFGVTTLAKDLSLVINGTPAVRSLTPPDLPYLENGGPGPYDIHAAQKANLTGTAAGPFTVLALDGPFEIYVDGTRFTTTVPTGAATLGQMLSYLGNSVDKDGNYLSTVLTVLGATGDKVRLEHKTLGDGEILIGAGALNAVIGFSDDQTSESGSTTRGVDANNKLRFLLDKMTPVEITLTTSTTKTPMGLAEEIDNGHASLRALNTGSPERVKVWSTTPGAAGAVELAPTTAVHDEAMTAVGFVTDDARGKDMDGQELLRQIKPLSGAAPTLSQEVVAQGPGGTALKVGSAYQLRIQKGSGAQALDTLLLSAGENKGNYSITAVTQDATYDYLTVNRPFLEVSPSTAADNQEWTVRRDALTLVSTATDLSSSIGVLAASANSVVGLSVGTVRGTVSRLTFVNTSTGKPVILAPFYVEVTDTITLKGPTRTSVHTVTEVGDSYVEVTPEVSNDALAHLFIIESAGLAAWRILKAALTTWSTSLSASTFATSLDEVDRQVGRLVDNKQPDPGAVLGATTVLQELDALYTTLQAALVMQIPVNQNVDSILKFLKEKGMDRAYDLLVSGKLADFFQISRDGSSYEGQYAAAAKALVQNDLPASRESDHDDQYEEGEATTTDANVDFSDQDDETDLMVGDDYPDEEDWAGG